MEKVKKRRIRKNQSKEMLSEFKTSPKAAVSIFVESEPACAWSLLILIGRFAVLL